MNDNIKIARQLVKLAKSLVASDFPSPEEIKKVIDDTKTDLSNITGIDSIEEIKNETYQIELQEGDHTDVMFKLKAYETEFFISLKFYVQVHVALLKNKNDDTVRQSLLSNITDLKNAVSLAHQYVKLAVDDLNSKKTKH